MEDDNFFKEREYIDYESSNISKKEIQERLSFTKNASYALVIALGGLIAYSALTYNPLIDELKQKRNEVFTKKESFSSQISKTKDSLNQSLIDSVVKYQTQLDSLDNRIVEASSEDNNTSP